MLIHALRLLVSLNISHSIELLIWNDRVVNTYCENQCNEGLKVQISNTMSVLKECQIMSYTMLYSVWEIDSGVYVTQKTVQYLTWETV